LARDSSGLLLKRMEECVDGEYQACKAKGGAYTREHFFGKYPELLELVADMSDEQIGNLHRGGHDPKKIYNAYLRAVEHTGSPTVILAKTVKGYGLGSAQARNATHQEKKLTDEALQTFRKVFDIPVPDEAAKNGAPYRPEKDTPEIEYMKKCRKNLGGFLPARDTHKPNLKAPELEFFNDALGGSRGRAVSTTMGFVSMLRTLLKHPEMGKLVVPIVPDEGRTFGLESAIRQVGIYASQGQLYTPHDQDILLYYREEKDGQILEEGITEAGSMASFTAAGTAYSNYRLPTIPFYMYYSMFGFQRVGDLIWAFGDARGKGFLMGGTAGRTTLSGEGLQHCDGHSIVMSSVYPTCVTYDPAYAYEIAVIVQDGLRRMYEKGEDRFYYITMYNEDYPMPEMPKGVEEGILRGIYKFKAAPAGKAVVNLFGSGPILNEALKAQATLAEKYGVQADVWSVTSYTELRRDALAADRWNLLHPAEKEKQPYILKALEGAEGPIIAASDYMKIVPDQLSPWLRERLVSLGTDGFGRSDNREYLRKHFEISPEAIVVATLSKLSREKKFDAKKAQKAFQELEINPEKIDPAKA
jgi:pyruvate dehydrogenase E1 component